MFLIKSIINYVPNCPNMLVTFLCEIKSKGNRRTKMKVKNLRQSKTNFDMYSVYVQT